MVVGVPSIFIFIILSLFLSPVILALGVFFARRRRLPSLRIGLMLAVIGCLEVAYCTFYLFTIASYRMDVVTVLFLMIFPILTPFVGFYYLLKHKDAIIISTEGHSRKRKSLLLGTAFVLLTLIIAFAAFQVSVNSHMYPQDSYNGKSNLAVKGVVTSIQDNYKVEGMMMGSYHTFRSYIRLNVTEILWVDNYLTDWKIPVINSSSSEVISGSVYDLRFVGIGYDNLGKLHLSVGQAIECKGDYVPHTDSPYSFQINVSPNINGSYLIAQP